MFLDGTYFQGELALPMLKSTGGPRVGVAVGLQTTNEQSLDWFIGKYEIPALREILGYTLAKHFIAAMQTNPSSEWNDLYDQIYREEGGIGYSPVANYVYYWTKRNGASQTGMAGEVVAKPDKAIIVSDAPKLEKAWNDMCPQILTIRQFVCENWEKYKEYAGVETCHHWYSCCPRFELINLYNL